MRKAAGQFIRYATVGLVSNAVGFMLYLAFTAACMEHKMAMTLLYGIGVAQTFIFNKRWSFRHGEMHGPANDASMAELRLPTLLNRLF